MRTRVITAVILLLLLIGVLFTGLEWVWVSCLALILVLAMDEWARLCRVKAWRWRTLIAGLTLIAAYTRYLDQQTLIAGHGLMSPWLMFAVLWTLSAVWLLRRPLALVRGMATTESLLCLPLGMLCLLALADALLQLYRINITVLVGSMSVVWVSDSVAYFAGRRFGKRKLAPETSPGKSWEGVWAALMAVSLMGAVWPVLFPTYLPEVVTDSPHPSIWMAALCLLTAAAGISGDLVESRLKRVAGVKDSGRCLPGHGGILDRIDALIPAMPVMAWAYTATVMQHA